MNSPQSADITPNARNPKLASETSKQTRAFALHPPSNSLGGLEQGGWALRKQSDGNAGPFREETEPPLLSLAQLLAPWGPFQTVRTAPPRLHPRLRDPRARGTRAAKTPSG